MMMNNENSRLSRIVDHNIYLKTDQLYEPLRNTLRKSTISSSFLSPQHHLTENRLSSSRVAKNMRSLSPAQTELIKQNIFIPINKELVPTRNLQKVMGKHFMAVNVEEKVGEAISPQEFSRIRTGTVEEIVYQIREDEQPSAASIYTASGYPTQRVSVQPTVQSRYVENRVTYSPLVASGSQNNTSFSFNHPPYMADKPQPTLVGSAVKANNQFTSYISSKEFVKEPQLTKVTAGSAVSSIGQQFGGSQSKRYDFRHSNASKEGSYLKMRRQKQDYKYNLFSLIDEGGNNNCQTCCGSNQFIAPKITNNPWL